MCRLCTALAGGLVQTWMPTPPDPSRVQTPAAGGRKSGDCSTTFIHTCLFIQIFIYFSKPLRLLYSLIIYEIVNFSFFALYSLLLLSFFLYLKSVPIYVIVHVHGYFI